RCRQSGRGLGRRWLAPGQRAGAGSRCRAGGQDPPGAHGNRGRCPGRRYRGGAADAGRALRLFPRPPGDWAMSVLIVMRKEIQESLRNRWVLANTLLLAALALTLSFLGSAPVGNVGASQLDVVI